DFVKIRYIEKEQRVKMEKAHMDSRSLIKKRGVILPNYKTEIIRKVLQIEKLESNIAIQKFPLKIAIVDGINDTKQLFHCVFGQNMDIIIKYSETSLRPKVGDYVKIRYAFQKVEFGQNKRKMLDISSSEQGKLELKKTVSGNIKIVYKDGKYFGFVNDYYVGSQYLYGIEDNDTVKIDVVYNGQKWSAYKLRKIE
ncbi:MAG: hypothetical protein IKO56_10050, partial [Alphaproteobacteria bacterium]|nr:hypothetical protein [Alphaproteobacteria bacterium]